MFFLVLGLIFIASWLVGLSSQYASEPWLHVLLLLGLIAFGAHWCCPLEAESTTTRPNPDPSAQRSQSALLSHLRRRLHRRRLF